MTLLTVSNLWKSFDERPAVKGVGFQVEAGEIVGLLGPNGAGKTTTIRSILNIYQPDEGEVIYSPELEGPDRMGYLPEDRGLYPDAPVVDILVYLAALKGISRSDARQRALRWLKRVELEQWADRRVETLSKGMQQKVQFIAAVIHSPRLAILDEVFSGLDPVNQELMIELIKELRADGMTLLISSHQINLVETLCERIVLVEGGEVILSGGVHDVKRAHGVRLIRLGFEGDGAFLSHLPGVTVQRLDEKEAVLHLGRESNPDDFLKSIVGRISVTNLSIDWPPLHDVFVDAVKSRRSAA